MEDTRKYGRFDLHLKAHYSLTDKSRKPGECTVINMSRKGFGLKFHTHDTIDIGSIIHLEVFIPEKLNPTSISGVLKWIEKEGNNLIGGIESNELLDEMKFSKIA